LVDKRDALQQPQPFPFAWAFAFVLFDEYPNETELAVNLRASFKRVEPQTEIPHANLQPFRYFDGLRPGFAGGLAAGCNFVLRSYHHATT
jgi:hypothetical protein